MVSLSDWTVRAVNLPEHAANPVHTDAGARAAGFDRALVAGVTTYAYLAHVPLAAWGLDWVRGGAAEVRFLAPVLDGDEVVCAPVHDDDGDVVEARVGDGVRARCRVWRRAAEAGAAAAWTGEDVTEEDTVLPSHEVALVDDLVGYAARAGDDLTICEEAGVIHPAVWPALANEVMRRHLVHGSWIHTSSLIRHHATAPVGATVSVGGRVLGRWRTRRGGWARVLVDFSDGDTPVATVDHVAIVRLAG